MNLQHVPLGELSIEMRSGFACGEEDPNGLIQLRMNNVTREGALDWSKVRRVPAAKSRPDLELTDGDILFNATNSPELVGKTALFTGFKEAVAFSNHFVRVRVDRRRAEPGFVTRWLQRQFSARLFEGMCRQWVNQASVTKDQLASVSIPLPPLDEQRRITAIFDQADIVRRRRREALAALQRLPLSIFDSMVGDPVTNPNGLKRQPLGELAEFISGGTPNKSQADLWGGNFPWVSPKDMKQLRISGASDFITDKAFEASSLKKIKTGTPLIVVRGMILAHTIPIAITSRELAINQDMKAIVFNDSILPEFGLWCMKAQHDSILSKVDTAAHGTKRLDTDRLRSIPIFTIPADKQRRFLERVEQWERMVNGCEEQTVRLDALFGSLQDRAFRGEL